MKSISRKCPVALESLLETNALLRAKDVMPDFYEVLETKKEELKVDFDRSSLTDQIKVYESTFNEILRKLPLKFRNYVLDEKDLEQTILLAYCNPELFHTTSASSEEILLRSTLAFYRSAESRYVDVQDGRAIIQSLIEPFVYWRKTGRFSHRHQRVIKNALSLALGTPVITKENTLELKININPNTLGGALHVMNINCLRTCEVCERIYWAMREKSKTCSKRCRDIFKVQQYRERLKKGNSK